MQKETHKVRSPPHEGKKGQPPRNRHTSTICCTKSRCLGSSTSPLRSNIFPYSSRCTVHERQACHRHALSRAYFLSETLFVVFVQPPLPGFSTSEIVLSNSMAIFSNLRRRDGSERSVVMLCATFFLCPHKAVSVGLRKSASSCLRSICVQLTLDTKGMTAIVPSFLPFFRHSYLLPSSPPLAKSLS